LVSVGVI